MNVKRFGNRVLKAACPAVFLVSACVGKTTNEIAPVTPSPTPVTTTETTVFADCFLNDGMTLPEKDAKWTVLSGHAEITDGAIHKTEQASEYEPVVLQMKQNGVTQTYEYMLLLDPYVAYVIAYFSENGDEKESLKLAYTYNCRYWFKLNKDNAVLKPETGTRRLRDPSFVRRKDGTFTLLATQGYDTDAIYAFDTADFSTYTGERLLQVNPRGEQAWAPEAFYDRTIDQYVIIWSSVKDGGMYYNLSPDLCTFSPPQKLLDTGFPVIDGTVVRDGERAAIILKDEREPMETYSQLFAGWSDHGWQNFSKFSEPFSGHQSEGPMIMKCLDTDGYDIYYDDYTRFQFRAYHTDDLFSGNFEPIPDTELMIPLDDPAHSHAIPVTWKELERLMQIYGE